MINKAKNKTNPAHSHRPKVKTLDARFVSRMITGLNCSRLEAEAIVEKVREIYDALSETTKGLGPGQIQVTFVDPSVTPSASSVKAAQRIVTLSLYGGTEDIEIAVTKRCVMTRPAREIETEPKGRRSRALRISFLVAFILLGACTFMYRDALWNRAARAFASRDDEPIPTQRLSRVSFRLEVPAFGEITGLQSVPVPTPSSRSGGLKVAWLISEGSFVKPGDTVVRFDSTEARLNLERQKNTLEANRERLKITTGKQRTDQKVLAIERTDAEKEYDYAVTVLPQDETIFSKWDIIEAKINANFAKERIEFLSNKDRVQKRIARADRQLLAIERNRAQSEIAIAKQTLDSLELKAPAAGLALYRRDRMRDPQMGDESWPGHVLVELVDLHALQARIYVLERDAGSLGRGKEVVIRLDSIPEKEFHGVIRSVGALAQPLERNSPLKYFFCEVTIRDAYQDMQRIKPGMSLKAEVILEEYDSCFVVPVSAIAIKGAETLAYVKQGDRFVPRPVKLGASTHGQSVVLSGLEENQIVAMRNPYETRKARLPDFGKAAAPPAGIPGGGMRIIMR